MLEPVVDVHLELPAPDLGPTMSALRELGAVPGPPITDGSTVALTAAVPAARLHQLQARLPDLTSGEGVLETVAGGYRPIDGPPPSRPRTGPDPRDRDGYLRHVNHHPA